MSNTGAPATLALGGHGVDSVHDAVDVEGHFRSGTQSLLDIDDEQGVFHGVLPVADLGQRHWASRDCLSTSRLSAGNISISRAITSGVRTGVWKAANLDLGSRSLTYDFFPFREVKRRP